MTLNWCGLFLLCYFSVAVFGQRDCKLISNETQTPNSNPNPNEDLKCLFDVEDVEALERRNRQLKNSNVRLFEQVKSLSAKFNEFKNQILLEDGVGLFTPSLIELPEHEEELGTTEKNRYTCLMPVDPWSITSCSLAMEFWPNRLSKKQTICRYLHDVEVLCDVKTDGGGWTIIQKRSSGPKEEFSQNWNEYEKRFGSLDGNFWLGLENIRGIINHEGDQELIIEVEDFQGNKKYAKYSRFSISVASDFYRLSISGFDERSTLPDSMSLDGNGMRFSTKDLDNDNNRFGNCAMEFGGGGGWWFNACTAANLNGLYFKKGEDVPPFQGVYWHSWKGPRYSLAKTEMKIRKRFSWKTAVLEATKKSWIPLIVDCDFPFSTCNSPSSQKKECTQLFTPEETGDVTPREF